ncbi:hypothetical protein EDF56_104533 [Novosphingobium sp. PhB165]|nr:hypothetical protein EDF56_104533 [Novosphingobium sp. PhB165]
MGSVTCMPRRIKTSLPAATLGCLLLAACHGGNDAGHGVPGDRDDHKPWSGIAVAERIRVVGTEPFWNAEIRNNLLTYRTPERPGGDQVSVARFAGRGGVSFSGTLLDKEYTIAIEPGPCSDGMSDRRYPFNALLRVGDEVRKGCAWSDQHPAKITKPGEPSRSAAESGIIEDRQFQIGGATAGAESGWPEDKAIKGVQVDPTP